MLSEAGEIVNGEIRLFGGPPVPLELEPPASILPLKHWTEYEMHGIHFLDGRDIKFLWEPARFGWAFTLSRSYAITEDDTYAECFWEYVERFIRMNPPNLGPQWASGQEVALRILALVFAGQVLDKAPASTPRRKAWLAQVVAAHAQRIPVTLVYARAQNNNHLISEAVGLMTASLALPTHPQATSWHNLGLKWANDAFQSQINSEGIYIQQSTNYHRLILHLALWIKALESRRPNLLVQESLTRLAAATLWLASFVDPVSGHVPNLGSNDGANILPLAQLDYQNFRPVVQAAARAFLRKTIFPAGPWDELAEWLLRFVPKPTEPLTNTDLRKTDLQNNIIRSKDGWASLRAVDHSTRPGHADQLHVEIWWHGINLAQDAGTYLYNAPPPWDNSLSKTQHHNTIEINGQDQMLRVGKFLWLDWAQAQVIDRQVDDQGGLLRVTAQHTGYARLGVIHRRTLMNVGETGWKVIDEILPTKDNKGERSYQIKLHWLLPDCEFKTRDNQIEVLTHNGKVSMQIIVEANRKVSEISISLYKAGSPLRGSGCNSTLGWYSPSYNCKNPALSCEMSIETPPISLSTTWNILN